MCNDGGEIATEPVLSATSSNSEFTLSRQAVTAARQNTETKRVELHALRTMRFMIRCSALDPREVS